LVAALAEAVAATRSTTGAGPAPGLPRSWADALGDVTPWLVETVDMLRAGR